MFIRRRKQTKLAVVPDRTYQNLPWKIAGYYVNGKRLRRFFAAKREAETFVQQIQTKAENLGTKALQIDQHLHIMAIECQDRLVAYGKTLADATEFYCQHLDAVERSCSLKELVPAFLQFKELDGARKRYREELHNRLKHFQNKFGAQILATITPRQCDDWLRNLGLAPRSRNNYRRILSVFFNYAVSRGYCSQNPIAKVSKAKVIDKPVEILTPQQMKALLKSALPELIPFIAFGAFAGLRRAELARLDWSEIHLERNFIEVSAAKSKTASRRLVTIQPNLHRWLRVHIQERGQVTPSNFRAKLETARKNAGIDRWPSNGLRHSYASYHLAKFQDAAALALQMGHNTTAMLFNHYREVVTPEAAEKYWSIHPGDEPDSRDHPASISIPLEHPRELVQ